MTGPKVNLPIFAEIIKVGWHSLHNQIPLTTNFNDGLLSEVFFLLHVCYYKPNYEFEKPLSSKIMKIEFVIVTIGPFFAAVFTFNDYFKRNYTVFGPNQI